MQSDTFNGRQTLLPSDTLFTLLDKQAKEFETFGKRMSLDVQNSYKIFIQQNELNKTSELNHILGKQQCQLESQSQLIDSLKSRIEELENDSIKKNHEIIKIKKDFLDFKKEIKLLFGLENSTQSFDHNNFKKVNSLFEDNDSDEFEFIHSDAKYSDSKQIIEDLPTTTDNIDDDDNIKQSANTENIWSNERLIADNNQSNEIDINNERLIFKKNVQPYNINNVLPIPPSNMEKNGTIVENKKTSIFGTVLFDEYFYNHSTFTDYSESSTSVRSSLNDKYNINEKRSNGYNEITNQDKGKSSSIDSKGKSKESDSKDESTEESLSDNQLDEELEEDIKYNPSQRSFKDSNNNLNQKLRNLLLDFKASELELKESENLVNTFNYVKQTSSSHHKGNISCLPPISIKSSTSQNRSVQGSQKAQTMIEQIQAEVQGTISRFQEQNMKIKQKTFNYLLNQFTLDSLIKYQETNYYNALAKDPKRSIKLMVKTALRNELCNKDKRVNQPIEEYVKRKIIPSLPPGIKSYAEYERTSHFIKLSDEKKKRIRKIITVEPK